MFSRATFETQQKRNKGHNNNNNNNNKNKWAKPLPIPRGTPKSTPSRDVNEEQKHPGQDSML
jgi:hypothetical protein